MSRQRIFDTLEARSKQDRPTHAVLTSTSAADTGRILRLRVDQVTTLGRHGDCTFRIDEPSVSGVHARIAVVASSFVVMDCDSTNGTFVNGEPLSTPRVLSNGDSIRLGPKAVLRFQLMADDEQEALSDLYDAAIYDGLTGVFNRRHLAERMAAEVSFARRHQTDLSLVLFDLDRFKSVNDRHGHLAGDALLKAAAATLALRVRAEDVVARYGGEEFAVLLRGAQGDSALVVAQRLRSAIGAVAVPWPPQSAPDEQITLCATASAGLVFLHECSPADPEQLILRADERLYRAKNEGRDRLIATDS